MSQQRVSELLDDLLDLPAEDQQLFLDRTCRDEPALRREVESLLAYEEVPAFFDRPAFDVHEEDPDLGQRFGPYEAVRLLGRGGMGAVYLAVRQGEYRQQVALKLIKRGMDSEEIVRRFLAERRILAQLDHPYIARLLDGGTTDDGRPFFVMEYVKGEPLLGYCDANELSIHERLRLFCKVCEAVHVAHQNLVVHRDLKPGNILVTGDGVPKLLDFGVAKLLQAGPASQTRTSARDRRPMTPRYASPEQIRGESITTASDVYSLGVLLYKLLTGLHPYLEERKAAEDIDRVICEVEPRKPSTAVGRSDPHRSSAQAAASRTRDSEPHKLRRRLAGDLDAIVLKALRKEPQERYGSVIELTDDIRRHLEGLPVLAYRGSLTYLAGKFLRRNREPLMASTLLLLLLCFIVTTLVLWKQAERERRTAQKIARYVEDLFWYENPDRTGGPPRSLPEGLDRARETLPSLSDDSELYASLLKALGRAHRNWGDYQNARQLLEESLRIRRGYLSPEHPRVVLAMNDLAVLLYDMGESAKAEKLVEEMIPRIGVLSEEEAISVRNVRAALLSYRGDYERADELFKRGLARRRELFGSESQDVAMSLLNLGVLNFTRGDLEQAETELRRALEIRKKLYRRQHTRISGAMNSLGQVLLARAEFEEAEDLFRQALKIRREGLGEGHPRVATVKRNLAALLVAKGQPAEARPLAEEALAALRERNPENVSQIAITQSILGGCWLALELYAEAEPLLVNSYPILRETRSERAIYTRNALSRLVDLYEAWGKPAEAARYRALRPSLTRPPTRH